MSATREARGVSSQTMRAAVLEAPERIRVSRYERPSACDGEVVVRIAGSGVCASSVPVWEGRPWFGYPLEPGSPGHEAWGVEVESGRSVAVLSQHAFAEYEVVPHDLVVPLPPGLGGAPFPGEALGCAMNVFSRSGIRRGDRVAIVGAGFLGLLLVQLCVGTGARVTAVSRRETGLALARSFGADTPRDPQEESFDVAIEATGAQQPLDLAGRLCRVRGRLVVAGYHQDGRRTVDMQLWNWRGLDVVNAHERDPAQYVAGIRAAVDLIAAGVLDPTPLFTHRFALDQLGEALELTRRRPDGFLKALVTA